MNTTHSKGWKSSEFWVSCVTILTILLPIVLPIVDTAAGKLAPNSWQGMLAAALVAAGYSLSRGLTKVAQLKAGTALPLIGTLAPDAHGVDAPDDDGTPSE